MNFKVKNSGLNLPSYAPSPISRLPEIRTGILGVGINAVSLVSAVQIILEWINQKKKSYVAVTNVHCVIEAQDDPNYKRILNESGLTVPDGMPLVWLSWLAGQSHVTRVYGPDLVLALSEEMGKRGMSAFFYGGNQGVAEEFAQTLATRYPGLKIAGTYCPPFRNLTPEEEIDTIQMINASKADVIWVGLGAPKQERLMAKILPNINQGILLGVGAAFDFHTHRVRQAPRWIQRSGFEWLFRLCMEPRRLWKRYLKTNPRFIFLLVCEKLGISKF